MTQHSSLKSGSVGARHRNVLKRHERVRTLQSSDTWGSRQSVYRLPKQKLIKLKVKKTKTEKEGEAPAEGTQAAPQTQQAQVPQQKQAPQKPSAEKSKGKEKE